MTSPTLWRIVLLCAAVLPPPAAAHDFWIEPSAFRLDAGGPVSLRLLIGDPGAVEHWATEWRKVVSLQDFSPGGVKDELGTVRPLNGAKEDMARADAIIDVAGPGTHLIAFASNHSLSDLPADKFVPYARHEGLALALADREAKRKTGANGRELYSRRAKAMIQVGPVPTDTVSTPIGQTLEIVPETNPYMLAPGAPLRVRIWFHGKPLAGASVDLERLGLGAVHGTPVKSDADGRVAFAVDRTGSWKINSVWSTPIDDPRADYETIFSSLTFGF